MTFKRTTISALLMATSLWSIDVHSQEVSKIIADWKKGTIPIKETGMPALLPFSIEWDAHASSNINGVNRPLPKHYESLISADENRFSHSVEALINNEDAIEFFANPKTIEAFNKTYQNLIDKGSPVGMIPRKDAMQYWMLSRTINAGPEVIAKYRRGGPSLQWCLPPIIKCMVNPKPVTK